MSPLNTSAPLASLMATLCGWPASLLSKWMTNGGPGGRRDLLLLELDALRGDLDCADAPAPALAGGCDAGAAEPDAAGCDGTGVGAA